MIGRGLDQVLPQSVSPRLHEPHVEDARRYVELAERENGPIPGPVGLAYPWGDALEVLDAAAPDARVVNLETAVTTSEDPWPGKGIHYRTHPGNAGVLVAAGIDVAVLANNHVLDWGRPGLRETLETLEAAGVAVAGAGRSASGAGAPTAVDLGEGRGRLLVFAAATPSSGVPRSWAAGPERAGLSLLPELSEREARRFAERIRRETRAGDRTVVSLHWGGNWGYAVPGRQRRFARVLLEEAGVDVVHGHSSHHPKGLELHDGRLVLYGCGDLLNDYEGIGGHGDYRPELRLLYLATLDADTGRTVELEMVPMRMRRFRLERAGRDAARWLRETLAEESRSLNGAALRLTGDGRLLLRAERSP